jgi:diketogulonate reductase-like aldo/keto reductase
MTTMIRIGATEVPRVGLGTNRLQDTDEHAAFIREAIDAGIRHIDTAHLYSGGRSESAIGAALASGRPDDLVVATKGGYDDSRPQTIAREIEESRQRLRTDRIDLYGRTVTACTSASRNASASARGRNTSRSPSWLRLTPRPTPPSSTRTPIQAGAPEARSLNWMSAIEGIVRR